MDIKKQIEREQLEKFVSNETLGFLVYNIENSEPPDFIANINKKVISIEHSRLIKPELQEIEVYKDKIIKNAQQKFEDKYVDKLYALITFNDIPLKSGRQEEQKYTSEVFQLIEKIYLNNQEFEFNIASKENIEFVSPLIESFSVDNKHTFSHWQHFGAYIVEWIDMNWLQARISIKEEKIKNYSINFDENWLLLVSDFGTKASANRTDFIDFSVIDSKFDKIYLYNYLPDEVTVIK